MSKIAYTESLMLLAYVTHDNHLIAMVSKLLIPWREIKGYIIED